MGIGLFIVWWLLHETPLVKFRQDDVCIYTLLFRRTVKSIDEILEIIVVVVEPDRKRSRCFS